MEEIKYREYFERLVGREIPVEVFNMVFNRHSVESLYGEYSHLKNKVDLGEMSKRERKDAEELFDCLDDIEKLLEVFDAGRKLEQQARRRQNATRVVLDSPRYTKPDAIKVTEQSRYFAELASSMPEVVSFQERVLGNSRITTAEINQWAERFHKRYGHEGEADYRQDVKLPEFKFMDASGAWGFIQSPANQILSHQQMLDWGISPIDHKAYVDYKAEVNSPVIETCLIIDPPGKKFVARISSPEFSRDGYEYKDNENAHSFPLKSNCKSLGQQGVFSHLSYISPDEKEVTLSIWKGSVLDELRELSDQLSDMFLWSKAEAAEFVLTGKEPVVEALGMTLIKNPDGDYIEGIVEMKAAAWVSPITIESMYRSMRSKVIARKNYSLKQIELELYKYVNWNFEGNPPKNAPLWKELFVKWNTKYPQKTYKTHSHFRQAYMRIKDRLDL